MKSDADDQISLFAVSKSRKPKPISLFWFFNHFLVFGQSKYCLKSTLAKRGGA